MRKPLEWRCNGCNEPPAPPPFVLCKKCFEKLCAKMDTMGTAPDDKGKVAKRIVFEEITPAEANARYRASMKAAEKVTG